MFFDLDDTLLATSWSRPIRAELATARIIRDHPHVDAEDLIRRILFVAPGTTWAVGAEAALKELGLQNTEAGREASRIWFFDGPGSTELLVTVEGAMDAIANLRPELRLGIITNGSETFQRFKYETLDLKDRIAVFLTSDRAGCHKPDVLIFQMALREADVEPHEAVFIGDSYDADIVGALGAGMHAVWYNPARHQLETDLETRHHELHSYADLAALLATLDVIEP
ncbi:MAG: HAD family hydrolase [Dehalococcoidia bacterium]